MYVCVYPYLHIHFRFLRTKNSIKSIVFQTFITKTTTGIHFHGLFSIWHSLKKSNLYGFFFSLCVLCISFVKFRFILPHLVFRSVRVSVSCSGYVSEIFVAEQILNVHHCCVLHIQAINIVILLPSSSKPWYVSFKFAPYSLS